jgi:nitrate reductase gamma subunit
MFSLFLFAIFPYVAAVVAISGALWRYFTNQYTYSSLSSQFLENHKLFWGSVPWHYGIIILLIGHLIGIFFPFAVTAFNGVPVRLYILEGTALSLGILALVGLLVLIIRRSGNGRIRRVTSFMDIVLLVLLLFQVSAGVAVALFYRWGSAWFVHLTPVYWVSLVKFDPIVEQMASLPLLVKLHFFNGLLLVALIPFTRLVHLMVVPIVYLWRPFQKVIWYSRKTRF